MESALGACRKDVVDGRVSYSVRGRACEQVTATTALKYRFIASWAANFPGATSHCGKNQTARSYRGPVDALDGLGLDED